MATSAFFAVLRDVTKLAASAADDLASQGAKLASVADDVSALAGHATVKTMGVAGDDLAVGAGQVSGVSPNRELPALWNITKGSALNKVWLGALLLLVDSFVPAAITGALIFGAIYLAYEGGEGLWDRLFSSAHAQEGEPVEVLTEAQKVKGAIRTDLVLSFEMLVIALASAGSASLGYKIAVLSIVGLVMTIGVYGLIGVIIRLDDMGLALARSANGFKQRMGRRLVTAAPVVLQVLEPVGMTAMFAVAGGILTHTAHLGYPHWSVALAGDIGVPLNPCS
jgi:predicted DNA repair protein MutK